MDFDTCVHGWMQGLLQRLKNSGLHRTRRDSFLDTAMSVAHQKVSITKVETLKCGAGFRDFCFVKMSTSGFNAEGKPIIGWSEYLEERNVGIAQVIEWMGQLIVGLNPLPYAKIIAQLKANTRHVASGIAQQGIAAIENCLLDVIGKVYNVAYNNLLVNPMTGKQTPPLNSLRDCEALGAEVAASGYTALKTNIFLFDDSDDASDCSATMYMPGFGGGIGSPELNVTPQIVSGIVEQMRTFRKGAGNDIGLKLDLNYNFKTDGFIQIAKALTPEAVGGPGIDWLELDIYSPQALRQIRDNAAMPIASLESLMGRKAIHPYLEAGAVDVCIIDPLWNGVDESIKMAGLCDMYEVNCAVKWAVVQNVVPYMGAEPHFLDDIIASTHYPWNHWRHMAHNYHGWLGTVMCAHFCAAIPNFKVLETDVDDVPWKDEIVTVVPTVVDGVLTLPMGPGWGVDVNEEALKKYPAVCDVKSGIWSAAGETK